MILMMYAVLLFAADPEPNYMDRLAVDQAKRAADAATAAVASSTPKVVVTAPDTTLKDLLMQVAIAIIGLWTTIQEVRHYYLMKQAIAPDKIEPNKLDPNKVQELEKQVQILRELLAKGKS